MRHDPLYTAKGIVCAVPPRQRVVEYTFPTKCTAETIPIMHILKVSLRIPILKDTLKDTILKDRYP